MTIDERLDKLTERHEALALSVEHLVAEGKLTDERLRVLAEASSKLAQASLKQFELHGKVQTQFDQVRESLAALVRVAEAHEHRVTQLEGGAQA
jgi:polyhydroxyalkanoate synthesis regulator phasin